MFRAQISTRLVVVAVFVAGCASEDITPRDSAIATDTPYTAQEANAPNPDAESTPAPVADTAPRATVGAIHGIRMVADGELFRFDPPNITVATGDVIRFVAVDGTGHNVAFDGSNLSSQAQNQLDRNIAERAEPLASAPVAEAGETITVSFAGLNTGTYPFFCAAHASLGMRGTIEVK